MRITATDSSKALTSTPLLAVLAAEGEAPSLPRGVKLPAAAEKDFSGKARSDRMADAAAGPAERVLLLGLGKEPGAEELRRAAARAVKAAKKLGLSSLRIQCTAAAAKAWGGASAAGQALAEGAGMGAYVYTGGKSKPKKSALKQCVLAGPDAKFRAGVRDGAALAEANVFARDLQNMAGNQMTPRDLAAAARKLSTRSPRISCRVMDEAAMKKMKMGLLLGVSRGSVEPARLIHLVYRPKGKAKRKVALVGKGLTFDAGGISLKPSAKMDEMRYDMSGSAAVLGAFHALAKLDVPVEVHGVVPTSENLADGMATKPGDIHTAMDGTTVEILNTDAEGRLILGDALCYVRKRIKPDTAIDLATLTGAVVVGLGHEISGMYTTTDNLRDRLTAAGETTGEAVWPLPLLDAHKRNLRGGPADLRNINVPNIGGGSIAGAQFLHHFIGDEIEWSHLDIAGTAWGAESRDYVGGRGGTGVGTRLLMQYLKSL